MTPSRARRVKAIAAAAAAALAVALLGAALTDIGPWYRDLAKPDWQPPDWLFGPAWTLIFGLAAMAGYLAWIHAPDRRTRAVIVGLFAVNAVLNVAWSVIFFRWQRPDWALGEVVLLWLSVAALIVALARVSRTAGALLVPYLAWVTFAGVLNLAIVRLNGPFR